MLELDDIQHFLLARPRALAARYGFLTFRQPVGARAWLSGLIDKVGTGSGAPSGRERANWSRLLRATMTTRMGAV
jgi:hypothetical protein